MGNNRGMMFVQWSTTHTAVWPCVSVFVCLSLCWLQSPVSVPHRIRSTSRSTREGKTLSEINCELPGRKTNLYLYQVARKILHSSVLLNLISCLHFSAFCSWSGEVWSSAQKGDWTPSWTGELSPIAYVCWTVTSWSPPEHRRRPECCCWQAVLNETQKPSNHVDSHGDLKCDD